MECSSRLNKGGIFVEISKYHNGARRGCLRAQKDFVRVAGLFLKGSCVNFFGENLLLGWGRRWLPVVVGLGSPPVIQGVTFGKISMGT